MYYRTYRYFTRPGLRAAKAEAREAGIRDRYEHPPYDELPRNGPFVVKAAYPFLNGQGDGIPQMHCMIMWPEGGKLWYMDITVERYKRLPKMETENPHAYAL